jgi:hypothetical protein
MKVWFEIMDTDSANVLADYDSEAQALTVLRDTITAHGRHYIASYALACKNELGHITLIAHGEQLAERALAFTAMGTRDG